MQFPVVEHDRLNAVGFSMRSSSLKSLLLHTVVIHVRVFITLKDMCVVRVEVCSGWFVDI